MLNILKPLACVTWSIVLSVDSFAMGFVIFPLSFIDVCVAVNESASAVGFVICPVSFIESVIFPYLFAPAISHAVIELPDVPDSFAHIYGILDDEDNVLILIVFEGSEFSGDGFGFFAVERFRFEVVILLGIKNDGIFALELGSGTRLTLVAHCYF